MRPIKLSDFSPHDTPATIAIDEHYQRIGLDRRWPVERTFRLCQLIGCTVHELGKLVLVDYATTDRFLRKGWYPAHIGLHFAHIEAALLYDPRNFKKDNIIPVTKLKAYG